MDHVISVVLLGSDGISEQAERLEGRDGGEGIQVTQFRDQVVRQDQGPQLRKADFQIVGYSTDFVVAAANKRDGT